MLFYPKSVKLGPSGLAKLAKTKILEMPLLVSIIERRLGTKRVPIRTLLRLVADALSYALHRVPHLPSIGCPTLVQILSILAICMQHIGSLNSCRKTHSSTPHLNIGRFQRSCRSLLATATFFSFSQCTNKRNVEFRRKFFCHLLGPDSGLVPQSGPKRTFGETVYRWFT